MILIVLCTIVTMDLPMIPMLLRLLRWRIMVKGWRNGRGWDNVFD